jgi:hypothetical protein
MRSLGLGARKEDLDYFGEIKSGREGRRLLDGAGPSNLSQGMENGNPPELMGRGFPSSLILRPSEAISREFGGASSGAIE